MLCNSNKIRKGFSFSHRMNGAGVGVSQDTPKVRRGQAQVVLRGRDEAFGDIRDRLFRTLLTWHVERYYHYENELSNHVKRQLGQFMTPDSIARTVARELGFCDAVVDFSVGEGALLQAVAEQALHPVELYGFDIDCRRLAEAATNLVNAHLREGNGLTAKLALRSGMRLGCVGNPPFVGTTETGLAWLPKAFAGLSGKLGTDRAEVQFLARALVTARASGARVVFVMPIGFADGDVYLRIRAMLMEQYQLVKAIEVSGGRAFLDTEARTVVLVIDTKGQGGVETEICEMSRADATPRLILKADLAPGARLDARYHKAMLSGPVGGPKLKDLDVSIDRGVLSRKEAEELCISAVHTTDLNRATNRRIARPMHEPSHEGVLTARKGDILLPRTGSRVRWEPVMMSSGEAAITDHVFRIRAPARVRELVYQSLCHPDFSAWLHGASKGVCAAVLTKRELLQMPVFAA